MSVRAAVVGVGYLGNFHAQKYASLDQAELIGVCDLDQERCKEVAAELNTKAIFDYKELLGQVDAVTIASTTKSHYSIAKFFLENQIHVNLEKPMTETLSEAEELCRIAEKNQLKFQVGHVVRFDPAFVSAREKLKDPLFMEVHRLAAFKPRGHDVDVVLDLMIHDLDVILSLVHSEVEKVSAVGVPVLTSLVDIANARIEFANGAVANLTASRVSQKQQRKFRVFQQDQYLSIDFVSNEVNLTTKVGDILTSEEPLEFDAWTLGKGDGLLDETKAFLSAIENDTEVAVSGRDGLKALQLAERIQNDIHKRLS